MRNRYLTPLGKWSAKARRLVFWIPIFSLLTGATISASIYVYLKRREIENQRSTSYQRARESVIQLDLELSNSLLRIQTFEDSLGPWLNKDAGIQSYLAQALEYTVFHRLFILRAGPDDRDPKLLMAISRAGSKLPQNQQKPAQSDTIISTIQDLRKSSSFHKAVLYEHEGQTLISVVMISRNNKNTVFVFSLPLISLFDKIDLEYVENIVIQDLNRNRAWIINSSPAGRTAQAFDPSAVDAKANQSFHFEFEKGLPQSGVALAFQLSYAKEEEGLISAANIGGLLSAMITLIISYLFYVLITLNKKAQTMIINKTLDLEKTAHDLQEALKGKTKFLGKVSHEIRTPLNLILGMVDLCEESDVDKKLASYLRSMKSSGEHLLSMIDDLLDLAKAESNDLSFHGRKTHLVEFLGDVTKLCSQDCESKGLKLYASFAADLPAVIMCDPNRLRQILLNLIRNACKYTNKGHVRLDVWTRTKEDGRAQIRFEVQDTGVGIPKDKVAKVFDAFFQVESSSAFSEGGVGLGLAIVKDIVKKMNGQIEVESSTQSGSTFKVDLDFEVMDGASWVNAYHPADFALREITVFTRDPFLIRTLTPMTHHPCIKMTVVTPDEWEAKIQILPSSHHVVIIDLETAQVELRALSKKWNPQYLILIGKNPSTFPRPARSHSAIIDNKPFLATDL
ncbi:MAG: HAMP domain-containing histidine kinase, partial [Bdellovibrionales bacterium]|nr:HAMP domain-containing histidine kinase [Bdellovibrionales bacterium]